MEIDPEQSIQEFRQLLLDLQVANSWQSEVVRTLGLADFIDILDNPPPVSIVVVCIWMDIE